MGLVGALAGLLSATAGLIALGSTARRLRQGLAQDVEILTHMRGRTALDLRADIRRRSHLLVATSRFPVLTLYDSVLIGVILAYPLMMVIYCLDFQEEVFWSATIMSTLVLGVGIAAFSKLTQEWTDRAARRVTYLSEVLGTEAATAAAKPYIFTIVGTPALVGVTFVIPSLWFSQVVLREGLPGWVSFIVLAVGIVGAVIVIMVGPRSDRGLFKVLRTHFPGLFNRRGRKSRPGTK